MQEHASHPHMATLERLREARAAAASGGSVTADSGFPSRWRWVLSGGRTPVPQVKFENLISVTPSISFFSFNSTCDYAAQQVKDVAGFRMLSFTSAAGSLSITFLVPNADSSHG